jgi:Polyketide cyclase / dehydrase and lipid transport
MTAFRTTIGIEAPTARVWAILMDVERWSEWTPTVTTARRLEPGPIAIGSRTRILQPKLPAAVWQVTELDESAGLFTWVTRSPGVAVTALHRLEPSPSGTFSTHSLDYSGLFASLIARLVGKLSLQYLEIEAKSLKTRCES